jgi:hypothetical protein
MSSSNWCSYIRYLDIRQFSSTCGDAGGYETTGLCAVLKLGSSGVHVVMLLASKLLN